MQTIYAFDFDGTITPIPGEYSEMYYEGHVHQRRTPCDIAQLMRDIMVRYIPPETVSALKTFFDTIHNQNNTIITIQTNNYRNVVIACLVYHIGVPLDYFDLEKSCFRECDHFKDQNLVALSCNPCIDKIIYFDDSCKYIKEALKCGPKLVTVNCCDGTRHLGVLLKRIPVIDEKSLNLFLKENVTTSDATATIDTSVATATVNTSVATVNALSNFVPYGYTYDSSSDSCDQWTSDSSSSESE